MRGKGASRISWVLAHDMGDVLSRYSIIQMDSLLRVSRGPNQGINRAAFPLGGSAEEESTSKLTQVVGRTQFFAVVGLRSSFLSLATLNSKASLWSLHMTPL